MAILSHFFPSVSLFSSYSYTRIQVLITVFKMSYGDLDFCKTCLLDQREQQQRTQKGNKVKHDGVNGIEKVN